jgi:hypothetical protein
MDIITFGSYELLLPDDPDLYAYLRRYRQEELLVVCNFSRKDISFTLPERFIGAELLISNDPVSLTAVRETAVRETDVSQTANVQATAVLGPFAAAVYHIAS